MHNALRIWFCIKLSEDVFNKLMESLITTDWFCASYSTKLVTSYINKSSGSLIFLTHNDRVCVRACVRVCDSYTTGTSALPDIYTQARGPQIQVRIYRQSTSALGVTIMFYLTM